MSRKNRVIGGMILFFGFLGITPTQAQYFNNNWEVTTFHSDIVIQDDGLLDITETIEVDFSQEPHHGIFRNIPIRYFDGNQNRFKLRMELLSVTDENDQAWWYETSKEGDDLVIKAGDQNQYFSDPLTFKLHYQVLRAIGYQDTHDELYWNVTGTEWEVPIQNASSTIHYPQNIDPSEVDAVCYTGPYGSTEQACDIQIEKNQVTYQAKKSLKAQEGLTTVIGLPKGSIEPIATSQVVKWFLADNWAYLLPLFTFLILMYLWATRGRNPRSKKSTIIPQYEAPEGMKPTEVGTILDEKVDIQDITATLIDMAVRGYLKIEEKTEKKLFKDKKNYTLHKLKAFETDEKLEDHEKAILKGVFGSSDKKDMEDLKYEFYKKLPGIKKMLYKKLVNEGIFPQRPDKVRLRYFILGIILLATPLFGMAYFILETSISVPIGIASSGLIVLIFARFMPAKTKKGVEAYYHILGLEDYIRTAEKDRLEFHAKENRFEKLLPYAMTLSIADQWCKVFDGLYKKAPKWFESDDEAMMKGFRPSIFWLSLNRFDRNLSTIMRSAPRSSGGSSAWSGGSGFSGGFSGGGFGGGGGGAW